VAVLWGVLSIALTLPAQAQSASGNNRAAAEALFNEGRSLVAKGKFTEACPKFEASEQLDPGLGTVLNLAECYEKLGKTASAWAEYREAIPLARASGSQVRLDLATQRSQALESRLSTLTIRAMGGDTDSAALDIRRDGVPVPTAVLGSAIPVDPGPHVIEATAPGKQKWSSTVQVTDAAKLAVEVPALTPLAPGPSAAPAAMPGTGQAQPGADTGVHSGSTQRTAALVVGAVGIVSVGIGAVFGLGASSKWSEAKSHCTSYPYGCDQVSVDDRSSANSKATVSTIAFIVGGAALGASAVLWLTADSGKTDSVAVGVAPGAAFVRGSF